MGVVLAIFFTLMPRFESVDHVFRMTAYDLSVEACGKSRSHPEYGICASGYNLKGHSIKNRKIAVDPKIIPMWSYVYINMINEEERFITLPDGEIFDLNGVYMAVDTGGAIKNHSIDLFFGEDLNGSNYYYNLCDRFGVQKAKISIMRKLR